MANLAHAFLTLSTWNIHLAHADRANQCYRKMCMNYYGWYLYTYVYRLCFYFWHIDSLDLFSDAPLPAYCYRKKKKNNENLFQMSVTEAGWCMIGILLCQKGKYVRQFEQNVRNQTVGLFSFIASLLIWRCMYKTLPCDTYSGSTQSALNLIFTINSHMFYMY